MNQVNEVNEVVMTGIMKIIDNSNNKNWSGTMTNLNERLMKVLPENQIMILPKSPAALRMVLNKVINRIRNRSVSVKFSRTPDRIRNRIVKFSR
jgi:hypothetical protein